MKAVLPLTDDEEIDVEDWDPDRGTPAVGDEPVMLEPSTVNAGVEGLDVEPVAE